MKNYFLKAAAVLGLVTPLLSHAVPMVITDVSDLDFSGNFVYAVNFNGSGTQTIGDASFTNMNAIGAGNTSGIGISGYNRNLVWGGASDLGSSADNNSLENVMSSIIWSDGLNPGNFDLNVNAGTDYRLQLLFSEGWDSDRHFDVNVEGALLDEVIGTKVGGAVWQKSPTQGYAMSLDFTATDSILDIDLLRNAPGDTNYHISGLTLELVSVPEPTTLSLLGLGLAGLGFARRQKNLNII